MNSVSNDAVSKGAEPTELLQEARVALGFCPMALRRAGKVGVDSSIVIASVLIADWLRLGPVIALRELPTILPLVAALLVLRALASHVVGVYRTLWRYTSGRDLSRVVLSTSASSLAFGAALYIFDWGPASFPRSIFCVEWALTTLGMMGIRVLFCRMRFLANGLGFDDPASTRVLIYGAGDAGATLAGSLLANPDGRQPVAFVDDDVRKRGALLHGLPVLDASQELEQIAQTLRINEIIIAIPSATSEQVRKIVFRSENVPCRLATLPTLSEILAGQQQNRIRDFRSEDLVDRVPPQCDREALSELLTGRRILVTGGGGSIGSELCRQIVGFHPAELILVGHGENSIFAIEQELSEEMDFSARAVIADIQDRNRLRHIFEELRPTIVFHAAAHKHVPLMEMNPEEAIKNNVVGTLNLAEVAVEFGVSRFIMVSSDKAVRPTSVMGATKRLAEMVIQSIASDPDVETKFTAVRFGNVLGSRGSLVPTLQRQIARGGPVTVTHPDMVRYFMTIPEAVQLMLQASTMGGQGEILVLDMGEPVKILDLARTLIRLAGLIPDKDIPIKFTGIRPGEKLFEEMLTKAEGAGATRHKQVFVAQPATIDPHVLFSGIARLEAAASVCDQQVIRSTLRELVPGYCSTNFEPASNADLGTHTSSGLKVEG